MANLAIRKLFAKKVFGATALAVMLAACGSGTPESVQSQSDAPQSDNASNENTRGAESSSQARYVEGDFGTSDGNSIALGADTLVRPRVIIFAQETCTTCIRETRNLISSLADPGNAPSSVDVVTILMGADQEIARSWRTDHSVPWVVAFDEDAASIKKYCKIKQTPCTLVELPGKGIVYEHTGESSYTTLSEITGEWK